MSSWVYTGAFSWDGEGWRKNEMCVFIWRMGIGNSTSCANPPPPQINSVHAHAHTYFPHFSALLYGWGVLFSSDFKWHKAIWGTSKRLNKKQVGEFIPLDPSLSHSSSASHCILGLLFQLDGPCSMTPGFLWVPFACPYRIKEDNSFPMLQIPGCLNTLYWLL